MGNLERTFSRSGAKFGPDVWLMNGPRHRDTAAQIGPFYECVVQGRTNGAGTTRRQIVGSS